MGGANSATKHHKGVVYSKATGEVVDCLFCRISHGESAENQLWYKDDKCVVFIPRSPVARLHLLIVPLQHIRNITTLTEEDLPLLKHMQKVAIEQLRVHSQYLGTAESELLPVAPPPSHYPFNRGHLPTLNSASYTYHDDESPNDSSFVLCFHIPPYNSIDHLHLHAIQQPYRTWKQHIMFLTNCPWHGSLEKVLQRLHSSKAKL